MPVLVVIVRFLMVLFMVRLVLRLFTAGRRATAPARPDVDLVRDRVCNTFVPRDRALPGLVAGRTEHFCSAACRDRAAELAPTSPS